MYHNSLELCGLSLSSVKLSLIHRARFRPDQTFLYVQVQFLRSIASINVLLPPFCARESEVGETMRWV